MFAIIELSSLQKVSNYTPKVYRIGYKMLFYKNIIRLYLLKLA